MDPVDLIRPQHRGESPLGLFLGHPRFRDPALAAMACRDGVPAAWRAGFDRYGPSISAQVDGDFAVGLKDSRGRTFLAVDRFAICTLCYRLDAGDVSFSPRCDGLAGPQSELDAQAIFDYLYHHVIPAPRTIYSSVRRLPAGHYAVFDGGRLTVAPWWAPVFEERHREPFERLRNEFHELLAQSVARQLGDDATGCFLSGGTDSSTVAGMLGKVTGSRVRTFSIGFDAPGYDEMEYARIAARHFATDHHEYYVTPEDLVRSIPSIAAAYDQPFGNSSVVPAYYCARTAREHGIGRMLAGDGGDELFGGNTRYATQILFAQYEKLPLRLRQELLEPTLLKPPILAKLPGVRKVVRYVEQARVPMPDRMQTYNLLVRLGVSQVLTPEFLCQVNTDAPLQQERATYAVCSAKSLINRMLAFDWRYTLADNDLPKIVGAATLAGVSVGFPMLDERLVDFSLRLEPSLKVKGLRLRWFFKQALRGFLPDRTIAKTKHGFGLPFGVWMIRHPGLRSLALESLDLLRGRGIVRAEFLSRLVSEYVPQHPSYYGEMVWALMMLAQWEASSRRSFTR